MASDVRLVNVVAFDNDGNAVIQTLKNGKWISMRDVRPLR